MPLTQAQKAKINARSNRKRKTKTLVRRVKKIERTLKSEIELKQFITGPYEGTALFAEINSSGGGSAVSGMIYAGLNYPKYGPEQFHRISDRCMIHKIEIDFEVRVDKLDRDIPYAVDLLMAKDQLTTAPTLQSMLTMYQYDFYGLASASNEGISTRSFHERNSKDFWTLISRVTGTAKSYSGPANNGDRIVTNSYCKNHRVVINKKIPLHFVTNTGGGTIKDLVKNAFVVTARAGNSTDLNVTTLNPLGLQNYTIRYWYTDA